MGPGSSISPPSPPINPVWVFKSKFLQRQDRILLLNFVFLKFDNREMFLSLFQPQYLKKYVFGLNPPSTSMIPGSPLLSIDAQGLVRIC